MLFNYKLSNIKMMNIFRFLALVVAAHQVVDAVVTTQEPHALQQDKSAAREFGGFALTSVFRVGSLETAARPEIIEHRVPTTTSSDNQEDSHASEGEQNQKNVRKLQSVSFADERAKVRTFANMNRVIYPTTDYSNYMDKLGEVFEAGLNFFGTGETAADRATSETALTATWHSAMSTAIAADSWTDKFEPSAGEESGLGVAAALYQSSTDAVLVFRGSHTAADFNNMFLWFEGWFTDRLQSQMMSNWQDATGESLTDAMTERATVPDLKEKAAFLAATQGLLVKQDIDWTQLGLSNTWSLINEGYWPLTKQLVESVLPQVSGKNFYITGHSQGGGRASLVSMWLEKTKGMTVPTYTFDGVGVQCAVRYALPAAYEADVDVTILHPQITQYVHALDAYGRMDYQAGRVCKFGTTELQDTKRYSPAKDFCARSVGWSGSRLLLPVFEEQEKDFSMCRYFTHWSTAVTHYLDQDSVLNADGTTDGGCANEQLVPAGDPQNMCPPCRTARCAVKLPELALNWESKVQDVKTSMPLNHPCLADNSLAVPMKVESVPLSGDLTQGGKFQHCTFLGGAHDYLLTGKSGSGSTQAFNSVFRVKNLAVDANFQGTFVLADVSTASEVRLHVLFTYTTGALSTPVTAIDAVLTQNTKSCGMVHSFVQVCASAVQGATADDLTMYAGVSRKNMQSQLLSFKVADLAKVGGLAVHSGQVELLLPGKDSETAISQKLAQVTTLAQAYNPLPDHPKLIPDTHMCLSGLTADQKTANAKPLSIVSGADEKCLIVSGGIGAKLSTVASTPTNNPPTAAQATNCLDQVKQRIQAAGAESLDVALINNMLSEMHLLNVPSLATTVSNMQNLDISAWLDEVKTCAASNPILSEFVCEALNNPALQPAIGSDEAVANKHIKDAVHYSILLDGITKSISADANGGSGILTDVFNAVTNNRPADWKSYFNAFEIAKTLTMEQVVLAYMPSTSWGDNDSAKKCCTSGQGVFALRVNILEAVLEDLRLGFPENADAGNAMVVVPDHKLSVTKIHKDLYETWNMAFVSHYAESPYFYAKLMAPAVTCALPEEYLFHRSMALFLHIYGVLYSRVARANGGTPVYETTDWNNAVMTSRWGVINKNTANPWLLSESLGVTFSEAGNGLRLDVVAEVGDGRILTSTIAASLANGVSGLEFQVTGDHGTTSPAALLLSADTDSCTDLGLAGLKLCVKKLLEVASSRRALTTGSSSSKTKVLATVTSAAGTLRSPQMQVLELDTPHPCLMRAWQGAADNFSVKQMVDSATASKSCTVLNENSFLSVDSVCTSATECSINAKVDLFGALASSTRRALDARQGKKGSSSSDADSDLDDDEEVIDSARALTTTSVLDAVQQQTLALNFVKKADNSDVRVQFEVNGYRMFDVDLTEESEQCLGASEFTICVERSTSGMTLPDGWSVTASGSGRRLLETSESVVGLTVSSTLLSTDGAAVKKVFPLAALDASSKAMHVAKGIWVGINNNEGFDATKVAATHDECRHITCPAGQVCFKGATTAQNPCYPDLFTTPTGESRSLMQQLVRLAGSSYAEDVRLEDDSWGVVDLYEEDGWSVHKRFCLSHESEFPSAMQLAARQDCAVISKKTESGTGSKLCAITFEGSDDDLEPIEPAFRMGTTMISGYEVWRGCAREYKRFKEHAEFPNWLSMSQDSSQCDQVYITGHSLGAAVAVLHRLDIEYGRLVTFASPPVFAPYSYPQFCFGDSFHMQQDIVKAFPLGFRLGGLREYSLCANPTGLMNSKGCNGFDLGEVNFCDIHEHHVLSAYRSFMDANAPASSPKPSAGVCTNTSPQAWIDKCVADKCAANDPRCAMGAEIFKTQLSYEAMRAGAIAQVRPGAPPALLLNPTSAATATSPSFSVPDLQELELKVKNPNLCPTSLLDQYASAERKVCTAIDEQSMLLAHGSRVSGETAVQLTALLFQGVDPASSAAAVSETAALVVHVASLLPEENALFVQAYPKNAPEALRMQYKLTPQQLLCRGMTNLARVCLVYEQKSAATTNVYSVDLYSFLGTASPDSAFKLHIADVDVTAASLAMSGSYTIVKEFGNLEQRFLSNGYTEVENDLSFVGKSTEQDYCAKIVPGLFCDFDGGDTVCDGFSNARCLRGGVCGCGANMCASDQGVCVPDTAADAFRTVGHPCIEKDADFELFQLQQDPSMGAPYERCAILGEKSFVRMQYPKVGEALASPTDLTVSGLVRVGFSVVPLSLERQVRSRVQLVQDGATGMNSLALELSETDLESGVSSTLVSQTVPLTDAQETCALVASGKNPAQSIPIADLCVRTEGPGGVLPGTTRALSTGDSVENTIAVSFCVPALFNSCYSVPVAKVVKTMPNGGSSGSSSRRLLTAADPSAPSYSLSPSVPAANEDMQQTPAPESEKPATLSPAIIVFISVLCITLLVTIICACIAYMREYQKSEKTTGRSRNARLSSSSIQGEELGTFDSNERPSPVMLARLENPHLFSRLTGRKDIVWTCSNWIPKNASVRRLLLNAWPMHVARVVLRRTKVIQLPLFPDEKYWTDATLTPTIRSFLAFRRSILMIFVGLALVIVAMGGAQEMPKVVSTLSSDTEALTHDDVKSMLSMFRAGAGGLSGSRGSQNSGAASTLRRRSLFAAEPSAERLGGEKRFLQSGVAVATSSSEVDDYTVEQAFEVKRRLSVFYTLMYMFKLFMAAFTLLAAYRALCLWKDYKASAKWTIMALTVRMSITVLLSWFPWYYMLFPDPEARPEYLNTAARMFIDVMLNLPVASVAMMVPPGVVGGARLVMELLPFTIVPYMIIFVTPLLSTVMLWPVLSVIGHGMGNLKLLYGSLIYVGYCMITSWAAFRALASLDAFRQLGRQAVEKTGVAANSGTSSRVITVVGGSAGLNNNRGGMSSPVKSNSALSSPRSLTSKLSGAKIQTEGAVNRVQAEGSSLSPSSAGSFLNNAIPTLLSGADNKVSDNVATEKEPVVSRRKDIAANSSSFQAAVGPRQSVIKDSRDSSKESASSSDNSVSKENVVPRKSFARRGSGAMTEIGSWVLRKMRSQDDIDETTNLPANLFATGSGSGDVASLVPKKSSRQSVELREAVVQGTLMSHLHSKMLPQVTKAWFAAFALFWCGLGLLLWGVYEEAASVLDVIFQTDEFVGTVVTMAVDAVINVLMIRICFTDLIFAGLVKMRLFNGYMSDDTVLTSFCLLQGYSSELNKAFNSGVKQMHRQLSMEEDGSGGSGLASSINKVLPTLENVQSFRKGTLQNIGTNLRGSIFGANAFLSSSLAATGSPRTTHEAAVDAVVPATKSSVKGGQQQMTGGVAIGHAARIEEKRVTEEDAEMSEVAADIEEPETAVTTTTKELPEEVSLASPLKEAVKKGSKSSAPSVVVGTPTHFGSGAAATSEVMSMQIDNLDQNHITTYRSGSADTPGTPPGHSTTTIVATNSTIVLNTSNNAALETLLREFQTSNNGNAASNNANAITAGAAAPAVTVSGDDSAATPAAAPEQTNGITAIVGGSDNILVRRNSGASENGIV
ncbi:unnamed protein product [Amoebophrya sp. A25]|nr:unnamed protein product [Amoebophrya sp. A25]|eukprot:GSA25T00004381001.1